MKAAHRIIEAEYEWPFQSHACMGPACAVADVKTRPCAAVDQLAEAALCQHRRRRAARTARGQGPHHLGDGAGFVRPQRGRRCRDGCRPDVEARGPAGARAVDAPRRHGLGSEEPGHGQPPPRRPRRRGQRHRLRVHGQGLLAPRDRAGGNRAQGHAGRPAHGPDRASPPCCSTGPATPMDSPTSAMPGRRFRRCWRALRRCGPRTCAIPWGPKHISPANRSSTNWRTMPAPIRSPSGCGTSPTRATRPWCGPLPSAPAGRRGRTRTRTAARATSWPAAAWPIPSASTQSLR